MKIVASILGYYFKYQIRDCSFYSKNKFKGVLIIVISRNHKCAYINYSITNRKLMPHYDIKITKPTDEANKRRPSIELSPTLEKPIYIVTKNMNGKHILDLVEALEKQKIQYQMQQETSTLGFVLNQRFFVIVDNKYGEVTLGADFASLLMTIVGYPRIGKNKKNKYYEKPSEIIQLFKQFKTNPEMFKLSRSAIKSNQDAIIEEPGSQIKNKIQVRSIIKYKSQDSKQSIHSHNSLKEACKKQCQRIKLIVMEDKNDADYASICDYLFANEKGRDILEKAETLDQIRKKTLFHTNKVQIYYLTNKKNSQQLINSIFIGEVVIYNNQKQYKINDMINEPKIYAIAYQKDQLFKVLHKLGIEMDPLKSVLPSKMEQTNTSSDSKNSPFLLKNQSNIKEKEMNAIKNELPLPKSQNPPPNKEMSKIDNNISIVSQGNETSDLNASIISKASSGSRKIKRLKKSKHKDNSQAKQESKVENKQNAAQRQTQRKKTLKSTSNDYYQTTSRSKKNLTFKQNLIENSKIRKIKSISKVAPEVFALQAQNQSTMTENQYYITSPPNKTANSSSGNSFFNRSRNSFMSTGRHKSGRLNGVFYRQFVPKLHNLAQIIKMNPSALFYQNQKYAYIHSFVYVREYDRFVRRLKNKMRELKQQFEEYNFIILLRDEDYPQFQQYCKTKNQSYDEEQNQFASTLKDNFSSISRTTTKMNLYVFVESERDFPPEVISFGRIDIFKHKLTHDTSDYNLSKTLADLKEKVISHNHLAHKQYLCA